MIQFSEKQRDLIQSALEVADAAMLARIDKLQAFLDKAGDPDATFSFGVGIGVLNERRQEIATIVNVLGSKEAVKAEVLDRELGGPGQGSEVTSTRYQQPGNVDRDISP